MVLVKTFNFSGSLCVLIYATGLQHSSSAFICFASISTFNQRKLITAIILGSTTDEKSHSHSQLLFYTADSELADWLTKAFTYLLPLGGLVGIPFVGFLLDKRSNRDAILVLTVFGAVYGVLGMTSAATPQIISIATLTIFRPLMYTAISDFSAKTFGFQTFGTGMTL